MTKAAHITSKPGIEVGEKAIALCGKVFKVKVLWEDVPRDFPLCRDCVDTALEAMTEADTLISMSRIRLAMIQNSIDRLTTTLTPDYFALDVIAETAEDFATERRDKAEDKAARKRAKHTCTCVWVKGDRVSTSEDCPVHSHEVNWHEDDPGVIFSPEPGAFDGDEGEPPVAPTDR